MMVRSIVQALRYGVPRKTSSTPRPEPLTYAQRDRLAKEYVDRVVAGFTTGQREYALLLLKGKRPKGTRGGQWKWTKARHIHMFERYAGWRDHGLSRSAAVEKIAETFGVGVDEIDAQITKARHTVKPADLPKWSQWVLIRGAKPPANMK